jgi:hypothetical protein
LLGLGILFVIAGTGYFAYTQEKEEAKRQGEARERADQERERIALDRRYENALLDAQRYSLQVPLKIGWSDEVQRSLRSIHSFRPEADLRDYAVPTLEGLDAKLSYEYRTHDAAGRLGYSGLAFDLKGERLVAAAWWQPQRGKPSPAVVWDGNNANKPVETTRSGTGPVAFPDADSPLQLLLPTGGEKALTLWNVEKNNVVAEIPLPGEVQMISAALSADARWAAASFEPKPEIDKKAAKVNPKDAEPVTLVWSIDRNPTGTEVKRVAELPVTSTALAFSPDNKVLAAGSDLGQVMLFSIADGKVLFSFIEGDLPVLALAFGKNYRRPSGRRPEVLGPVAGWLLAVGSKGGALSVWNLRTKTRLNSFYGSEHDVFGVAFNRDGT